MLKSAGQATCSPFNRREQGFALVLVIWGLGIVSLLIVAVMTTGRQHAVVVRNLIDNRQAEFLAEAGIALLQLRLSAQRRTGAVRIHAASADHPIVCLLTREVVAALTVRDEQGKIDLNAATPGLLSAALRGFGLPRDAAAALEANIADFTRPERGKSTRLPPSNTRRRRDNPRYAPKFGPFESIYELGRVPGFGPERLKRIEPFVTVHSHNPGIDPMVAPQRLLAVLAARPGFAPVRGGGAPRLTGRVRAELAAAIPANVISPSRQQVYALRAEVLMPSGAKRALEAIVVFGAGTHTQIVREWRNVGEEYDELLRRATIATLPSCRKFMSAS